MRIMIGSFQQETNTFSPVLCDLDRCRKGILLYGEDLVNYFRGKPTQLGAFLDVLEEEEAVIIPSISIRPVASGPVMEEVYREAETKFLKTIEENWPLDGVLLQLHGATVLTEYYDGTGRLLEAIRKAVGDEVPIAGTLDLHANVTEKMMENADILIPYHTFPHVDAYEIGLEAANLLVKTVKREVKPVMALCKLPMLLQAEACRSDEYPIKKIMDMAREIESREGVLSASVFQMQPFMDVEDAGASVIVIADGSQEVAAAHAKSLAKAYWDIKEEVVFELTPLEYAVERAVTNQEGPVIISDSADSPSSGAPGDSTVVLDYLLKNEIDVDTIITMVDAAAVEKAIEVGVGNEAEFSLGGKIGPFSKPVTLRGTVKLISDGEYIQRRKAVRGVKERLGKTVIIKTGKISIVVMEKSSRLYDPAVYYSVGLMPEDARLVVVKSALAFRELYEDMAKEIYVVDTPGVSSANLRNLPFKKIRRPMYPFDEIESLDIEVRAFGHRIQ